MRARIRVVAWVGVFVLAVCGCQKGNPKASQGSPDMAEAMKADSKMTSGSKRSGTMTSSKTSVAASQSSEKEGARASVPHGALTEADNGMEYDFRVGQTITVVLDSNKGTGLSWSVVEPMNGSIVPQGSSMYAAKAGKDAGGRETWRFRCAKPGYQTVKMEYRRKWAQSSPERTFRFSGTVR